MTHDVYLEAENYSLSKYDAVLLQYYCNYIYNFIRENYIFLP